jgi:7TMR-DISM extracellular 2/7TM diverse intracellular signalling
MAYSSWQSIRKFTLRILPQLSYRAILLWVLSALVSGSFASAKLAIPDHAVSVINVSSAFEHFPEISEAVPIGKAFEDNRGVTVHHAFSKTPAWFRLQYRYASDAAEQAVLSLGNYTFVQVDFYSVQNGEITGELHTGAIRPFGTRYLKLRDFTFPLPVSSEDAEIYIRIQSSTPLNFTPRIRSLDETLQKENTDQILGGLLFGAQAILILYNFFLFLSLRDRSYLFYSLYITGWLLFETKTTGFLARYVLYAAPGVDVLILPGIFFLH